MGRTVVHDGMLIRMGSSQGRSGASLLSGIFPAKSLERSILAVHLATVRRRIGQTWECKFEHTTQLPMILSGKNAWHSVLQVLINPADRLLRKQQVVSADAEGGTEGDAVEWELRAIDPPVATLAPHER